MIFTANLLDAQTVAFIIAALISPLVGLITKWSAPPWFKSALNLSLTTLGAVIATVNFTDGRSWETYLVVVFQAWVVSIAAHYGFYKPTSASGKGWFQDPDSSAGRTGVGANVPDLAAKRKQRRAARSTHTKRAA